MTEVLPRAAGYPQSLYSDPAAQPANQITMDQVRAKYPQYANVSDGDLLVGLYKSKYADQMHISDFLGSIDGGMFAVQKTGTDLTRQKFMEAVSQPRPNETPDQTFQRTGGSANGPVGDTGGAGMNALRQGAQGATFGAADEMTALGASVFGGKSYDKVLQQERDRLGMGMANHPVQSVAANMVGGAIPAAKAGKAAIGTGSMLEQSLRSMGAGATGGAAYGFGAGEGGFRNRSRSMAAGAAVGGVGGLVAPKIVQGMAVGSRGMGKFLPSSDAREVLGFGSNAMADRKVASMVAEALQNRKTVPQSSEFMPGMMLGDVLDNGSAMNGVVRSNGPGRERIISALKQRQLGQGTRVTQGVEDSFGTNGSARKHAAALTEGRTLVANFDYGLAREQAAAVRPSSVIAKLDEHVVPKGRTGDIPKGTGKTKIAKVMGKYKKMLVNKKGKMVTDYDALLAVRKSMSDEAFKLKAKHPNAAKELRGVLTSMDEMLSKGSPSYKQALSNFREESKIIDGVKLGAEMGKGSAWRAVDAIGKFNEFAAPRSPSGHVFRKPKPTGVSPTADLYTQRAYEDAKLLADRRGDAVRSGFSDGITGKIANQRPYADKTAGLVEGNMDTHAKLMGMAKDPAQLARVLRDESKMNQTFAKVTQGSQTADNATDVLKIEGIDAGILSALMSGKPVRAGVNAARGAANVVTGNSKAYRNALSHRLLATGDKMDAAIAMALNRSKRLSARRALQASTLTGSANAQINRSSK